MVFCHIPARRLLHLRSLRDAALRAMPDTVSFDEFTDPLLFVLSIRLNRLTGGAPEMTFSARCHMSETTAPHWPMRLIWRGISAPIDLYCAAFRGEMQHCATAWINHQRRR